MNRAFAGILLASLAVCAPAPAQDAQEGNRALPADGRARAARRSSSSSRAKRCGRSRRGRSRCRSRNATSAWGRACSRAPMPRLPRYFKDADRVMDLETRLLHCMTTLQGRSREEATRRVFGNADGPPRWSPSRPTSPAQSRGMKMAPGRRPSEGEGGLRARPGAVLPARRAWDFSCARCHGEEGKRIRHAGAAGALQARERAPAWWRPGRPTASRPAGSSRCSGA